MNEEYWYHKLDKFDKNYERNVEIIKSIPIENRGYVFDILQDEHIISLFSGGMDFVPLIDVIMRNWNCKVILLYFKRNSKNQVFEEKAVDYFYNFYQEQYPENIQDCLKLEIEIPSRFNKNYLDKIRQKVMGLPLRNAIMWNNAFTQTVYLSGKYKKTIGTVMNGSVKEDEKSPESGILSVLTQNLQACISMGLWYYQLLSPFIDGTLNKIYSKVDLLKHADEHHIPLEKSRSCFGADEEPCNECLACENRNNAFKQLKNI